MKTKTIAMIVAVVVVIAAIAVVGLTLLPKAAPSATLKMAVIYEGSVEADAWNIPFYESCAKAQQELGTSAEISFTEGVSVADAERVLREYIDRGYTLIWAHSWGYGDTLVKLAGEFPNVYFMHATGTMVAANLNCYNIPHWEGTYLGGMLAGGMTTTNKVGAVGGFDIPDDRQAINSFILGAQEINPDVTASVTFSESWSDIALNKEAAIALADAGVDVILALDGVTGPVLGAQEKGIYAIGLYADMYETAPDTVITSVYIDWTPFIVKTIGQVKDGTWVGNLSWETDRRVDPGLAEGVVTMTPYRNFESILPQDLKDKVSEKLQAIMDGTFQVPRIVDQTLWE